MTDSTLDPDVPPVHHQVVGRAVRDLTAARLARGFIPLALLCGAGLLEWIGGAGAVRALALVLGGPVTGVAMLAYGLKGVQTALGRPARPWMGLAVLGGVVPLLFGIYVLGWRGLRGMAAGGSPAAIGGALLFTLLGIWVLRSWWKLVEIHGLVRAMMAPLAGDGKMER